MNILLVNQEHLQAEDLQRIQRSLDTSLFFAVTYNDALRIFKRNHMDYVILDYSRDRKEPFVHFMQENPTKTRVILTGDNPDMDTGNLCHRFEGHPNVDELINVLKSYPDFSI